ncbi:MAG: acetyltransferase [Armatimonadota bacterium]
MAIPLLILGAGPFAEDVFDVADDTGLFDIVGFACSIGRETMPSELLGLPVHWLEDILPNLPAETRMVCGIGSAGRSSVFRTCRELGFEFANVIHPTARISRRAVLGHGVVVGPLTTISTGCRVGDNVIVNRGATVGHHTVIEAHATLSPGVNLAGHVSILSGATVGMGANVLETLTVGENAFVGSGSVVTRTVAHGDTVVGVPAKPLERAKAPA